MSVNELWLINLLFIWGIYAAFKPDMILGNIGDWIEDKLKERFQQSIIHERMDNRESISEAESHQIEKRAEEKRDYWLRPVIGCPICMPSLWGVPVYLFCSLVEIIESPWFLFPIYLISMSGMNYILAQLISKHITVERE